jgi:lysophospholipase L1-like esterase
MFPDALFICLTQIQRWSENGTNISNKNAAIIQMANTYSIPVISGYNEIGITRELEANGSVGTLLKDGLHPNEKGQNLYARMFISEIKSRYVSFSGMNN